MVGRVWLGLSGAMVDDKAMPWTPLLLTDPERAWKVILNQDDSVRAYGFNDVRDLLFGEIIRIGYFNEQAMAAPLARVYDYFLDHGMPSEVRAEIYRHVVGMVENTKIVSVNAFTPFFCRDPDRGIASTAALDYVSLAPMLGDDPMRSSKELIEMIEAGEIRNPGAVFGALLVLGDPRLCKLLWPLKDRLSYDEANEATQCTTGFISAATIDFVLSWLEGLEGTCDDRLFGSLAAHLGLQRRHMQMPFVATGPRPFPVTSVTPEELRTMQKLIPIEDYVNSVAPRMLALARAEPEPKALSFVLRKWGIAAPSLNN
jgi:hypothetical protein